MTVYECPLKDQIVTETKVTILALDRVEEVKVDMIYSAPVTAKR